MPLSLLETQAVAKLAEHLYDYLPGKAHPYARPPISFETVSAQLGLGSFWPGGSKLPAITMLLERTLEDRRGCFCDLVLAVVREAIKYRMKKGQPLTHDDVETLNQLILGINFRIPELWDPSFLDSLPSSPKGAREVEKEELESRLSPERLAELQQSFLNLEKMEPRKRGFAFERFLKDLFAGSGLAPAGRDGWRGNRSPSHHPVNDNPHRPSLQGTSSWSTRPAGERYIPSK